MTPNPQTFICRIKLLERAFGLVMTMSLDGYSTMQVLYFAAEIPDFSSVDLLRQNLKQSAGQGTDGLRLLKP